LALRHITEGVRWTDEEAAILAECNRPETGLKAGLTACYETGPGKVLQGLWRDFNGEIPCYAAGTWSDITGI
jgi:[acyl-carrier-protein] S-malonyltransferase